VLAAVTLLAGLAAGYAAGRDTGGAGAPAPNPAGTPSVSVSLAIGATQYPFAGGPAVVQLPPSCSVQHGTQLELGVDLMNQSGAAVTLTGVSAVFPGGGRALREAGWEWATCGAIPAGAYQSPAQLPPGATTWLTVTVRVLVRCPAAYPVLLKVAYTGGDGSATELLSGFNDLGDVGYSGCGLQTAPSGTPGYYSVIVSPALAGSDGGALVVPK
jgi:hypothetical protein